LPTSADNKYGAVVLSILRHTGGLVKAREVFAKARTAKMAV
jgi:hypothetical protein